MLTPLFAALALAGDLMRNIVMKMKMWWCGAVFWAAFGVPAHALSGPSTPNTPANWSEATEPFRVAENVYYVGTNGLASYLITSGRRAILLDTSMATNAPLLETSIERLGFRLSDVKIIVISHAHWDHVGALAQLKQDTGASLAVMKPDVAAIEGGQPTGDNIYPATPFASVRVDRVLRDGDTVVLGRAKLRARLTPGHTKGCTTWLMRSSGPGPRLNIVFPCSLSVAGNVLVGNRSYPGIAGDYRQSFRTLRTVRADVVLTNHPEVADVLGRRARQLAGAKAPFRDTALLARIVNEAQQAFELAAMQPPIAPHER